MPVGFRFRTFCILRVFIVDGGAPQVLACNASTRYTLVSGLDTKARHNVTLALRTEAKVSNRTTPLSATPTRFRGFVLDAGATVLATTPEFKGKMVVVGDSITAGWGNTNTCCGQPGARSAPCADPYPPGGVPSCRVRCLDGPRSARRDSPQESKPLSIPKEYGHALRRARLSTKTQSILQLETDRAPIDRSIDRTTEPPRRAGHPF